MVTDTGQQNAIEEHANKVADLLDSDVLFYNGLIKRPMDELLIEECRNRTKRNGIYVILVTTGGDAHAAYRIARAFQREYDRFVMCVSGYCKSAGTLLAIGAHELVMDDHGELGPLDIQMRKKDEIWEQQSGLTIMDTLRSLHEKAFNAFEDFFLDLQLKSGGSLTASTAGKIATDLAAGLFSPIYGQVDPLHIGEAGRGMGIAGRYGERLLHIGGNVKEGALPAILSEYPAHGFVIDREEAMTLFTEVRKPVESELSLLSSLNQIARLPNEDDVPHIKFLSEESKHAGNSAPKRSKPKTDSQAKVESSPALDGKQTKAKTDAT